MSPNTRLLKVAAICVQALGYGLLFAFCLYLLYRYCSYLKSRGAFPHDRDRLHAEDEESMQCRQIPVLRGVIIGVPVNRRPPPTQQTLEAPPKYPALTGHHSADILKKPFFKTILPPRPASN
ncbi:unnamed protein product [Calicophoron daubneyi]|uniref:Uncharacterized protein n=1 Tax=Calicophoron daubneyi TaxID=300641 RepID=A0AAV2T198_CALDB